LKRLLEYGSPSKNLFHAFYSVNILQEN
jgi:hypothetical protein